MVCVQDNGGNYPRCKLARVKLSELYCNLWMDRCALVSLLSFNGETLVYKKVLILIDGSLSICLFFRWIYLEALLHMTLQISLMTVKMMMKKKRRRQHPTQ